MKRVALLTLMALLGWTQWVCSEDIRVVTEELPPYNYTDDNGRVAGYSTEVVEAVLRRANLSYTIEVYPWARAYNMALAYPDTLIYTMGRNADRELRFKWVGPIAPRQLWLFKLKARTDIHIQTLEDARQYLIGVIRADSSTQFLKSRGFEETENLDTVTHDEQNLRKLLAGRVDLIMGNELALAHLMKRTHLPFEKLEKVLLLIDGSYWMGFSLHTRDTIVEQARSALDSLKQEQKLDALYNKYLE